ncbi:hypothetical protein SK128_024966 [Halocaridina rubra]|uniref:C2H2-type domain-containing protein n=1 Tax=Halocaridina rubra TaxID=373956 RepID=A0AAN8X4D3_HALRR
MPLGKWHHFILLKYNRALQLNFQIDKFVHVHLTSHSEENKTCLLFGMRNSVFLSRCLIQTNVGSKLSAWFVVICRGGNYEPSKLRVLHILKEEEEPKVTRNLLRERNHLFITNSQCLEEILIMNVITTECTLEESPEGQKGVHSQAEDLHCNISSDKKESLKLFVAPLTETEKKECETMKARKTEKENELQCRYCTKTFATKYCREAHEWRHSGKRPHKCHLCGNTYCHKSYLQKHMKMHRNKEDHKCEICGKIFSHKCSLTTHMSTHTGEKPFKCTECGKGFHQKGLLTNHLMIHSGEKPFVCKVCGRKFSVKRSLHHHERMHTGEKPYVCDVCGKSYARRDIYKNHMTLHTGEKHYKCDVCSKEFSLKTYLTKHMLLHYREKARCQVCGKEFPGKGRLKLHMWLHTGEKPYSCNYCGKRYAHKSNMKDHARLHTGEKPYECNICGERFHRNFNLQYHLSHSHATDTREIDKPSLDVNFEQIYFDAEDNIISDPIGENFCLNPSNVKLSVNDCHTSMNAEIEPSFDYLCDDNNSLDEIIKTEEYIESYPNEGEDYEVTE